MTLQTSDPPLSFEWTNVSFVSETPESDSRYDDRQVSTGSSEAHFTGCPFWLV